MACSLFDAQQPQVLGPWEMFRSQLADVLSFPLLDVDMLLVRSSSLRSGPLLHRRVGLFRFAEDCPANICPIPCTETGSPRVSERERQEPVCLVITSKRMPLRCVSWRGRWR